MISGGLQYITSVFFPSLLALCIRFLGVIQKNSWNSGRTKKTTTHQQKTEQKTTFVRYLKNKKNTTRRKLLEVPTSRHPGNSLIWPHLMTVKLFFCFFLPRRRSINQSLLTLGRVITAFTRGVSWTGLGVGSVGSRPLRSMCSETMNSWAVLIVV